jgi:hypothetical protein
MSWASIIEGIARFLKVIFGMDKPAKVRVIDERQIEIPPPDDRELLRSLGVRHRGAENRNPGGNPAAGEPGADPRKPPDEVPTNDRF